MSVTSTISRTFRHSELPVIHLNYVHAQNFTCFFGNAMVRVKRSRGQQSYLLAHSPLTISLLSQFSRRFCTAALQSCSTVNALCSDAIVGFLGWPPASPAPPRVRNLPRWLCSRPSVASSRPPARSAPRVQCPWTVR
jgi:hypothetical protein